jgi:hypothetical protein
VVARRIQTWAAYINTNNPLSTGPTGVRYGVDSLYGQYVMTNPDLAGSDGDGDFLGTVTQKEEYNMISWLVEQIFNDQTNSAGDWGAYGGAI